MSLAVYETFKHCPQCGTLAESPAASERFLCTTCDFCFYFNPACAVAAIILNEADEALFIRRKKMPSQHRLSLPGGFVDPGESLEEALVRETKEEVNLKIIDFQFLCSAPNQYQYCGITYFVTDSFFTAKVSSFTSLTPQTAEVAGIEFLPLCESTFEQLAFPSLKHALSLFQKQQASATS